MLIILAAVAVLAAVVYTAAQVAMHRAPTGYKPMRNAVSDYGVGTTAGVFRASIAANTVVLVAVGAEQAAAHHHSLVPLAWLAVAIVGRAGVAVFPTDVPGTPHTVSGRVHLAAAIVQFTGIYEFLSTVQRYTAATALGGVIRWLVILTVIGLIGVVAGLVPVLRRWFGLFERVFLWCSTIGIVCVAVALAL